MVIKVYVSGISASQEVRKKQQKILFILESLKVGHEVVDITEPGKEDVRTFMKEECLKSGKTRHLPPQIFSDQDYLGDYDDFEIATENESLAPFLRLGHLESEVKLNNAANKQSTQDTVIEESQQNEGEPKLVNGNDKEGSMERDLGEQGGGGDQEKAETNETSGDAEEKKDEAEKQGEEVEEEEDEEEDEEE